MNHRSFQTGEADYLNNAEYEESVRRTADNLIRNGYDKVTVHGENGIEKFHRVAAEMGTAAEAQRKAERITARECYELAEKSWMPAAASEALVRAARTLEEYGTHIELLQKENSAFRAGEAARAVFGKAQS